MADIKNHSTLTTNLVSYWDLEEASGTRYDLHGSNNLTDNNTVGQAAGKTYGNGADFETTGSPAEYLNTSNSYGSTSGSISMWVKPESLTTSYSPGIISTADNNTGTSNDNGFYLRYQGISGSEYYRFAILTTTGADVAVLSTTKAQAGTWVHIVCTWNTSEGKIYINGSLEATQSTWGTMGNGTTQDLIIGTDADFPTRYFDGLIDEVGIWSKVLTTDEISDLYNSGSGLPYYDPADVKNDTTLSTSLVSYWELEEDTTADRTDSHGSNDLTANESIARATGIRNDGDYGIDFTVGDAEDISIADGSQTGLEPTGDFSWSMWIKPETAIPSSGAYGLISKDNTANYDAYIFILKEVGGNDTFRYALNDSAVQDETLSVNLSTATWYHIAFTYDLSAGTGKIYLNGVLDATTTGLPTTADMVSTADFQIGAWTANAVYFDGVIDEVGWWGKELTVEEIRALYGYGTPPIYDAGGSTPVGPTGGVTNFSGIGIV